VSYALFSKAGFTSEVEALAAAEGIRLVQAGQLVVSEPAE
jgi:hypothetical protein